MTQSKSEMREEWKERFPNLHKEFSENARVIADWWLSKRQAEMEELLEEVGEYEIPIDDFECGGCQECGTCLLHIGKYGSSDKYEGIMDERTRIRNIINNKLK